jgi:cytochrome c556
MLENLGAVNAVAEGVALEDYDGVARAAEDLKTRAAAMKDLDISTVGLDGSRDVQFDAFLTAQQEAATAILSAAKQNDGRTTLLAVQHLLGTACLACHQSFREPANRLSPAVLFMTTFLNSWREINRGLSINDFTLVGENARELQAMGRVLAWDQVIQTAFSLDQEAEFKTFRSYLNGVLRQADRIEQAALEEDASKVLDAGRQMWTDGCIACHDRFR